MGRASPPHANLDAARAEVDELRELGFDVALLDERLRTAAEDSGRGHHQRAAALTHEVMVLARAMRRIDFTSVTRGDDPTLTGAEADPVHDLLGRVRADLFHLDVAEEEAPGPSFSQRIARPVLTRLMAAEQELGKGRRREAEMLTKEAEVLVRASRQFRQVTEEVAKMKVEAAAEEPDAAETPAEDESELARRIEAVETLTRSVYDEIEQMARLGLDVNVLAQRAAAAESALEGGDLTAAELALREALILAKTQRQLRQIQAHRSGEALEVRGDLKADLAAAVAQAFQEYLGSASPAEARGPAPIRPAPAEIMAGLDAAQINRYADEVAGRARAGALSGIAVPCPAPPPSPPPPAAGPPVQGPVSPPPAAAAPAAPSGGAWPQADTGKSMAREELEALARLEVLRRERDDLQGDLNKALRNLADISEALEESG